MLSLSSTFALFLCFHIRFHLPFLKLTSVSFSLLPSSIRVVLTLSLTVFPSPVKNQREADTKNAWNLTTISPLHLCGVNLMQVNFLKQDWQWRYNVILGRDRVMLIQALLQQQPDAVFQKSACMTIGCRQQQ